MITPYHQLHYLRHSSIFPSTPHTILFFFFFFAVKILCRKWGGRSHRQIDRSVGARWSARGSRAAEKIAEWPATEAHASGRHRRVRFRKAPTSFADSREERGGLVRLEGLCASKQTQATLVRMAGAGEAKGAGGLVRSLYLAMRSMEYKVGGGEGIEGIYGSITESGVTKIMEALAEFGGMDKSSTLLDVGAGLGRPLLHALVAYGVKSIRGIEVDPVKCQKAKVFVEKTLEMVNKKGTEAELEADEDWLQCRSIESLDSLGPTTHVYTFWEGIPVVAKEALGALFSESATCKAIAVVQRALRNKDTLLYLDQLGFTGVEVAKSFPVTMSGSGRTFRAYIICKCGVPRFGSTAEQEKAPVLDALASDEQVGEAIQQKKRRGGVKSARGQKHSQSSIPFMKIKKFARARRQKS